MAGCLLLAPGIKYLELCSGLDLNFHGLRVSEALQEGFRIVIPNGLPVAPSFHESFWQFLPTFYTQLDRFTWSHLWFLAYLLACSALLLPVLAILAQGSRAPSRVSRAWVYAPILPLVAIQLLLRERWPGPYNLVADWANFSFFATFLITGIVLARVPALENALVEERKRSLMIAAVAVGLLLLLVLGVLRASALLLVGVAVAGWCCVAAILGFMHAHSPRGGPFLDALAESALPVYLLHQPVIVLLGFGVVRLPLGVALKFTLLLVGSTLVTLVLYLQVRRFAVTRFLTGMRPVAPEVQSRALSRPSGRSARGLNGAGAPKDWSSLWFWRSRAGRLPPRGRVRSVSGGPKGEPHRSRSFPAPRVSVDGSSGCAPPLMRTVALCAMNTIQTRRSVTAS